jgi:hypothetical protein
MSDKGTVFDVTGNAAYAKGGNYHGELDSIDLPLFHHVNHLLVALKPPTSCFPAAGMYLGTHKSFDGIQQSSLQGNQHVFTDRYRFW